MLITVPVISFFIVTCCFLSAAGGRGVFVYFRQTAYISFIIKAFIVFYYCHPLTAYIGYLHLPARASIRVVFFHNFISIFLFVTLLPFFSAGYQSDLAKERRPLNPNHSQLLARAVCFGPGRFWAGNLRSPFPPILVRLSFKATLSQLLGYA